jgi:alpha-glucoside transport system permease protein
MAAATRARAAGSRGNRIASKILVNGSLLILCILWLIPTLGLLVSSVRQREDINSSGWWTVLPHQEYVKTQNIELQAGLPLDQPVQIPQLNITVSDDNLRAGYKLPDGRQISWENRRSRIIAVKEQQWVANTNFTFSNYTNVLGGERFIVTTPEGISKEEQGQDLSGAFISSLTVAIPATVIPILIAAFAAYAFAWIRFPGRGIMFGIVVALLVVPLQVALVPIFRDYTTLGINGTYLSLWLAHTGFGLPLATYLLYNYISGLPREILESAYIDGASQFTIFTRLIMPLSVPALASFAIFQFLWVWNDYLVALIFLGSSQTQVLTMRLASIVGSRGQDWYLLTSGAFISMLLPLVVFLSLQRYFVRGLLAGSVKG